LIEFKLPEIGENIKTGNVVGVFVAVGDTVKEGQDLLELETEKASLPVPSPCDGIIKEIFIKPGDDIKVGSVMMNIDQTSQSKIESRGSDLPPKVRASKKEDERSSLSPKNSQPLQPEIQTQQPVDYKDKTIAVIGGGPGGYAAAFLAADLGMDITLINPDVNPGGVCLYRGCIPSKALLHAAKILSESREAEEMGIKFAKPTIHLDKLRDWKNKVVAKMTGGLGTLVKQRKIKYIQGTASFTDSHTVQITKSEGAKESKKFDSIVVATGSRPIRLPIQPDSRRILDSASALEIENVPNSLLIIGAGYIGLELGTVYAELGSQVSVVEMMPGIIPGADRDLANILENL